MRSELQGKGGGPTLLYSSSSSSSENEGNEFRAFFSGHCTVMYLSYLHGTCGFERNMKTNKFKNAPFSVLIAVVRLVEEEVCG